MPKKYFFLALLFCSFHILNAQNLIAWSNDKKITFQNFKKTPIQNKKPQGFLDSKIGWQISESTNSIPVLEVYNRFDESTSWISMKHEGILKEMQLQFDLSELYARKIRKDFVLLQQKKEMNRDVYREHFLKQMKIFQKRLKSIAGVTLNQPSLYKLINAQVQDSITLYKEYKF